MVSPILFLPYSLELQSAKCWERPAHPSLSPSELLGGFHSPAFLPTHKILQVKGVELSPLNTCESQNQGINSRMSCV